MVMFGHKGVVCAAALIACAWMPRAAAAEGDRIDSRMFELTYADAKEVADNFNRTWRGQAQTNGNWSVGEIAVPFVEVNSVMVTAVLGRGYTDGTRQEPGDRKNAVEGVLSLDLRDLEDRAKETRRE